MSSYYSGNGSGGTTSTWENDGGDGGGGGGGGVGGGAASGAAMGTMIMPGWGTLIGAGIGAASGLLTHKAGKKANKKYAARRQAAENAIRNQGQAAKGQIRRTVDRRMAGARQDLARRGIDSTSVYDAVLNDSLDRQFQAEAGIDERVGSQVAQLIAGSPDPYDGNAMYASLSHLAGTLGQSFGKAEGGNLSGGGASREAGTGGSENLSPAKMAGLDQAGQLPTGGPIMTPSGGAPVTPDQFDARTSGQLPGQVGYSPYGALLDGADGNLEMDGSPKPAKRRMRAPSIYDSITL